MMPKKVDKDKGTLSEMEATPTLLLGLGGTGAKILRRIKKTVLQTKQEDITAFLILDTDTREFAHYENLPDLNECEFKLLGVNQCRNYADNRSIGRYSKLTDRFPVEHLNSDLIKKLANGKGAAQIRALGALAFALEYNEIKAKISKQLAFITSSENREKYKKEHPGYEFKESTVNVFIVSSIAGGTGSGTFIDAALLTKLIAKTKKVNQINVSAYLTLPSAYDSMVDINPQAKQNIRSNAYAALKEIEYLSDINRKSNPEYSYGQHSSIISGTELFDFIALIDDTNLFGSISLTNVYDFVAHYLSETITSPYGAALSSSVINALGRGMLYDDITGKPRPFAGISSSVLEFPADRIAQFCTYRTIEGILSDCILRTTSPTREDVENEVKTFLNRHELDDFGKNDQIIDSLLVDSKIKKRTFKADISEIQKKETEFTKYIQAEMANFNRKKEILQADIEANYKERVFGREATSTDRIYDEIYAWTLECTQQYGVEAVVQYLEKLRAKGKSLNDELLREKSGWEDERAKSESNIVDSLNKLKSYGIFERLRTVFGSNAIELKKIVLLEQYNKWIEEEFDYAAISKAAEIAKKIERNSDTILQRWRALGAILKTSITKADVLAMSSQTHERNHSKLSIYETVTNPGYETDYYQKHKKNPLELFPQLVSLMARKDRLPDSEDTDIEYFYNWLLETSQQGSPVEVIMDRFKDIVISNFWSSIFDTNIFEFVLSNDTDITTDDFKSRIEGLFEKSAPYLSEGDLHVAPEEDIVSACTVSASYVNDGVGAPKPHPILAEWQQNHHSDTSPPCDSLKSYQVKVNKLRYGLAAYYIENMKDWEQFYKSDLVRADRQRYMIHTHSDYLRIPNLIPTDTQGLQLFALGMAFGFIATKGNTYYKNIERRLTKTGESLCIPYKTQWDTIHSYLNDDLVATGLVFQFDKTKIPSDNKLEQGRIKASNNFNREEQFKGNVSSAINLLTASVGNMRVTDLLLTYNEKVLSTMMSNAGDEIRDQLKKERDSIDSWINRNRIV